MTVLKQDGSINHMSPHHCAGEDLSFLITLNSIKSRMTWKNLHVDNPRPPLYHPGFQFLFCERKPLHCTIDQSPFLLLP